MTRGFRRFLTKRRVELPEPALSHATLQNVLLRRRTRRELSGTLDLVEVGALLRQALRCTAVFEEAEEGILHAVRAWPSAGGLYPLDAYAIVRSVSGLEPGVYYFNPINSELESIEAPPSADRSATLFLVRSSPVMRLFMSCSQLSFSKRSRNTVNADTDLSCSMLVMPPRIFC